MIRIYPYPFSKYVKSLPDPPPGKSRDIKNFECKKYENDYTWLLEAKNNLKKCFYMCNVCSKKFNYMRCLVKNSNVHYEYNSFNKNIEKLSDYNKTKDKESNKYNIQLCDNNNNNSNSNNNRINNERNDNESENIKNNIIKIKKNIFKNDEYSNQSIDDMHLIKNNSIIFSNSLSPNENNHLSFNDDVFIFLDYYTKKHSNSNYKKTDEESYNEKKNFEKLMFSKYGDHELWPFELDDMIIHIKKHVKHNISYFSCKHVNMNDLYNSNEENNNYDNINIYVCDNNKEQSSMNNSIIDVNEYDMCNIAQSNVVNSFNDKKDINDEQNEIYSMKNVCNTTMCSEKEFCHVKNNPYYGNEEHNINNDNINKNEDYGELFNNSNVSSSIPDFNLLCDSKERIKNMMNNNLLPHCNKGNYKNSRIDNTLKYNNDNIDNNEHNEKKKNNKSSTVDHKFNNDNNVNYNKNKSTLLPLNKIDDGYEENIQNLSDGHSNSFYDILIDKKNVEICTSSSKKKIIFKKINNDILKDINIKNNNNKDIINENHDDGNKENFKKFNNKPKIHKEDTYLLYTEENNSHSESTKEKNKNILKSRYITHIVKEKMINTVDMPSSNLMINDGCNSKESIKDDSSCIKENISTLNKCEKKIKNNVHIDDFNKKNILNGVTLIPDKKDEKMQKLNNEKTKERCDKNKNENNIYNEYPIDNVEENVHSILCENNKMKKKKKSDIKEYCKECKDKLSMNNYDIKINCFSIDEKEKSRNFKLLDQIKNDKFNITNEKTKVNIHDNVQYNQKEEIEDIEEINCNMNEKKNSIENISKKKLHINQGEKCCSSKMNKTEYFNNSEIIENKEKEQKKEEIIDDTYSCKENRKKELEKKLNNILNFSCKPNKINIHNKIYTTNDKENKTIDENSKVVYINNNYFFNIRKNDDNYYIEKSNDIKIEKNFKKYNLNNLDLEFCKNENDFYGFKYMSNVLSSSCNLSKEYNFNKSFESNIVNSKIDKLNDLKKKILIKKYLNEIAHKKKNHAMNSINKKVSHLNRSPINCNMDKNKYDEKLKCKDKLFIKDEKIAQYLHIKQRKKINNQYDKISKNNVKIYKAPKSPKQQDKIPKPLASQLEINSLSYLKNTPSYPFEEFNF
ncbi:hypothetical protein PGSY75_0805300 [Plasmodium gaboni]|uniref:C2H2-type domain-containing protein n=1 Tax=Plasmodium gaboni TaxID=647221 RepID=A0A151LN88_9APIC|nr:hypothetical protein PGSY75_0805300 [Plasmodium gaboni]KYO00655.1 hypothetical protein PGSY75_0805300 [Plasmodium gaboni]